jgi:hypothetical protein
MMNTYEIVLDRIELLTTIHLDLLDKIRDILKRSVYGIDILPALAPSFIKVLILLLHENIFYT